MPNGHSKKEYGTHEYPDSDGGRVDCKFGCGCWVASATSNGPLGVDPFGACPMNPKDGNLLGGKYDYENLVTYRIRDLEFALYKAKERLTQVSPSKKKLADELAAVRKELAEKNNTLGKILGLLGRTGE